MGGYRRTGPEFQRYRQIRNIVRIGGAVDYDFGNETAADAPIQRMTQIEQSRPEQRLRTRRRGASLGTDKLVTGTDVCDHPRHDLMNSAADGLAPVLAQPVVAELAHASEHALPEIGANAKGPMAPVAHAQSGKLIFSNGAQKLSSQVASMLPRVATIYCFTLPFTRVFSTNNTLNRCGCRCLPC
jgi:hypothetical protein